MINPTDFHRMWIAVPAKLRELLDDGQALTCSHEQVQFVLVHVENVQAWRAAVATAEQDPRPVYLLLLNHYQRTMLAEGEKVEADVQDTSLVKVGTIKLTPDNVDELRSEHGAADITSTVAAEIKAGDFFAVSERTEPWRDWVVYRASSDFDAVLGELDARRTTEMETERTGGQPAPTATFRGAGQVVFLLTDPDDMLERLGWPALEETPA